LELLLCNSFQCHRNIFFFHYTTIFVPLRQTLFWKEPEVIWTQMRGIRWLLLFSNLFFGPERERLLSCSIVMVQNGIVGPKFRHFSMHSFT